MAFRHKVPDLLEKIKKETESQPEKNIERMGNRFSVTLVKIKGKNHETKNS